LVFLFATPLVVYKGSAAIN